ncbi:VOC family protein [Chloroflexota bacterium]
MFKTIDHVEMIIGNVEKTLSFYTDILGFNLISRKKSDSPTISEFIFIELGGAVVEILVARDSSPTPREQSQTGFYRIALQVENMAKTLAYLKEKGVTISREPASSEPPRYASILDPEGHSIELKQPE